MYKSAWYLQRSGGGIESCGNEFLMSEAAMWLCKLSSGLLQEEKIFLTNGPSCKFAIKELNEYECYRYQNKTATLKAELL